VSADELFDYLDVDDLLILAGITIGEVRVRDAGLLASAAERPRTTVFGKDAYPSLAEKAAALLHSIARNHALVDGNKRLAWTAMRAFCLLNGHDLRYDVDEAEALVVGAASGTLDVNEIAAWISNRFG
jgi:death on curing protein